jgi:P27 family predicted phage terminase small subunit
MRGRTPKPTALRRLQGNPGKRAWNHDEPEPAKEMPDCPPHLSDLAAAEWLRIAGPLQEMGVLTIVDRAALAAYCQAYGRWAEAEEKLKDTPVMLKAPSGYVQQNPWLSVANKQLEIMGRYMAELGITPASRSRVRALTEEVGHQPLEIVFRTIYAAKDERIDEERLARMRDEDEPSNRITVDPRL